MDFPAVSAKHYIVRFLGLVILGLAVPLARGQEAVPVQVGEVRLRPVMRQVPLNGSVNSLRFARLSTATSGLVEALSVDVGSRVEQGQVLLQLDDELAEHTLESTQALLAQAQSELSDARRRLSEAQELAPQRSIAESIVRGFEAEVVSDEAALRKARSDVAYQQALVARHSLRAPFAGVISARMTELGEWLAPGQTVMELVASEQLLLDFAVPEDYLGMVNEEAELRYRLNTEAAEVYRGEIETLVPVTDPAARTFLLRVRPAVNGPKLGPGMSVRASLLLPTGREGVTVPLDAILRYPDGRSVVWVLIREDGELAVRERRVRTGLQFDGVVDVVEGLQAGDEVVLRGNEALQDGQRVRLSQSTHGSWSK